MKKILLSLSLALHAIVANAQTITITPEPNLDNIFDFGMVQIETYLEKTYTISTTSSTPINLSYVWGNSGLGVSSCYKGVNIFTVESISSTISESSPGTLIIRFNPRSYSKKTSFQGNCISNGTANGAQFYVGDLQLSVNNTYNTTMNFRGEGVLEPTGIFDDNSKSSSLAVFPNPTTGKIFLIDSQNWTVLDVLGNEVLSGNGNEIDLSDLENSSYLIKTHNNNSTKVARVIKQ